MPDEQQPEPIDPAYVVGSVAHACRVHIEKMRGVGPYFPDAIAAGRTAGAALPPPPPSSSPDAAPAARPDPAGVIIAQRLASYGPGMGLRKVVR
jgi:hypothetical protein